MTKAIAQTYNVINDNIRLISYVFLVGCLLLITVYGVSIFSIISKTVALEKIEAKMTLLSNSVDELDSKYLSLSGQITPDSLQDYGMSRGQVGQYISRTVNVKIGLSNRFNQVALIHGR